MRLESVSKEMAEELERNEGLRVLARIIAGAYLVDVQRGVVAGKPIGGDKDEGISKSGRNRTNGKRGK